MVGSPVLRIDSPADLSRGAPVRRLVAMVVLLAVKDRATEVRFEASPPDREWKLRYHVGGRWYDMVPVPLHVPISREVGRLGGIGPSRRLRALLSRLLPSRGAAQEESVRLQVAGQAMELGMTVTRAGPGGASQGEVVVLRLPEGELPSEAARRILGQYLQGRFPAKRSLGGG